MSWSCSVNSRLPWRKRSWNILKAFRHSLGMTEEMTKTIWVVVFRSRLKPGRSQREIRYYTAWTELLDRVLTQIGFPWIILCGWSLGRRSVWRAIWQLLPPTARCSSRHVQANREFLYQIRWRHTFCLKQIRHKLHTSLYFHCWAMQFVLALSYWSFQQCVPKYPWSVWA